jgi:hypothetical protein
MISIDLYDLYMVKPSVRGMQGAEGQIVEAYHRSFKQITLWLLSGSLPAGDAVCGRQENHGAFKARLSFSDYGGSQCLDHETGKIRCIQTDAVGSDQSTKCSSAGVR